MHLQNRFLLSGVASLFLFISLVTYLFHNQKVVAQSNSGEIDLTGYWSIAGGTNYTYDEEGCHSSASGKFTESEESKKTNGILFQSDDTIEGPTASFTSTDGSNILVYTTGKISGNKLELTRTRNSPQVSATLTATISGDGNTFTGIEICDSPAGSSTAQSTLTYTRICGESKLEGASEKKNAIKTVNKFCTEVESNSPWQLKRSEVANRLIELIRNPDKVEQGKLFLCGPAAFFHIWLKHDPEAAANFATELYNTGASTIGSIEVKPDQDLVNNSSTGTKPADWMMLSALRDAENWFSDYEGTRSENASAITTPKEMKHWLEATGLYSKVVDETGVYSNLMDSWKTQNIEHAKHLIPSSKRDVIMLIFSPILDHGSLPNHYIVLTSPIKVQGDQVLLKYWNWGKKVEKSIPMKKFLANYYGAIIAEKN